MKKIGNDRAITLIALVLTIIILLLLAGISISMISGQDGILVKASKAKKEMNRAQVEESIGLAIAEWELEKESNKSYNVTLKEYLDSREEITKAKIDEPLTIVSGDNVVTIDGNNDLATRSKSKNLIKNGYLEDRNNNNFSRFNYHQDGYLYMTNCNGVYVSNELVPIDTSKKYRETFIAKKDNTKGNAWIGFAQYDIDKKEIAPKTFMYIPNTLTYLTKELKNGDTEIYLNDLSNFKLDKNTPKYQRGIIVWNYKDSTGYQYPPLTYSRNVWSELFDYNESNPSIDIENNIIKLKEPWSNGTIAEGTQISQSTDGATFNYAATNLNLKQNWQKYTVTINGIVNNGLSEPSKFRSGAKYIRFLFLSETSIVKEKVTIYFKDIVFEEVE